MLTKEHFKNSIIDDVKQAMLDVVDEYGVDDWYDQYQEA